MARANHSSKFRQYHPTEEAYSVPIAVVAAHETTWHGCGTDCGPFSLVRWNLLLARRPLGKYGYGDPVEHQESAPGSQVTSTVKLSYEYERVTVSSIIEEHLNTSEVATRLQSDQTISAPELAQLKLSEGLEERLSNSFRTSRSFQSTEARRVRQEHTVGITINGGSEPSVLAVPYERWAMSVRLNHIDYLSVEYRPRYGKWRYERCKEPGLLDGTQSHMNWRGSGIALGEFQYWVPAGKAQATNIAREKHRKSHINPAHVDFLPGDPEDRKFYDLKAFRGVPSLYKISNAAFPLKHDQRKAAWTDAELLDLPDQEEGSESLWYWDFQRLRKAARTGPRYNRKR